MEYKISIISSDPLSNLNTKANTYLHECLKVNSRLADLTASDEAELGSCKEKTWLTDSHVLCNSHPTLLPSISC